MSFGQALSSGGLNIVGKCLDPLSSAPFGPSRLPGSVLSVSGQPLPLRSQRAVLCVDRRVYTRLPSCHITLDFSQVSNL